MDVGFCMYFFQAIHDFREIEKSNWTDINQLIIDRVRQFSFPTSTNYIRFVHVLDLSANGYIKPHIDSVRVSKIPTKGLGYRNDQFRETTKFQYCGDTISGISLLSDSVGTKWN